MGRHISEKSIRLIVELFREGQLVNVIAAKTGHNKPTLRRIYDHIAITGHYGPVTVDGILPPWTEKKRQRINRSGTIKNGILAALKELGPSRSRQIRAHMQSAGIHVPEGGCASSLYYLCKQERLIRINHVYSINPDQSHGS